MTDILANSDRGRAREVTVDVIVPVYRGLSETRACIESVLSNSQKTGFELIVIDDCSPEAALSDWLNDMAAQGKFTLLKNNDNTGFVATANRGMALHPDRDVVLLNSDAAVANDWLDRLHDCAYTEARIATVTPFSNNAVICSYPKFCENNKLPDGLSVAELDSIFSTANHRKVVELPTGVGFCLYIRRDALNEVGLFDAERFGTGYGEENDFCQRAIKSDWKNVLAADVFVRHVGGVSFGAGQELRKSRAMEVLKKLHPNYPDDVRKFIAADPVRTVRLAADIRRLSVSKSPVILAISHSRGGGTQKHIDELVGLFAGKMHCLLLRTLPGGRMELVWREFGEVLSLNLDIDTNYDLLIETLRAAGVCRVHFHTLVDIPEKLHNIAQDLGAPIDFTIHDYYSVCPRIDLIYAAEGGYCGEKGEAQCKTCLQKSPALGEIDIKTWRSRNARFMTHASRVFAPSRDVEKRMLRYVPDIAITVVPHPEPVAVVPALRNIVCLPAERPLRIFVLGALTGAKGADVLEACAVDAAKRNLPLHFELIGFSYRTMCVVPDASLVVHGRYRDGELATLLKFHAPDLVWFPALSPETYSYTLSAALAAGLPVVVPDLGALAERVAARPWSWIVDWKLKPAEMNDWFVTLREKSFAGAVDAGAMSEAGAKPGSGFDYVHEYLQPVGNAARRPVDFIDYSALAEKICVVSKRPQVVHADHEVSTIRAVTREGAEVVRSILAAHRHLRVALLRIAKILWWSITLQLFAQYRRWRAQQIDRPHFAPPTNDHAVVVPFQYVSSTGGIAPNLAVVCHMFFAEMADEFKGYLSNIPFGFDLYITTDRDEKKLQIEAAFKSWRSGNVEVRITPNRGRDIAPKLITCFDVYSRYEFVLHLHTKNSPHARHLAGWRKYLLETLVGSPAIVTSVFEVFQRHPRVGMISPQHFEGIRPGVGWGRNYAQVNSVARRLALKIDLDGSLDFPSGSMFWARSAALVPLLNIGLSFDDFPPEQGQQDGTPAHVIERLYFYVCETAGFDWIKIARPELLRDSGRRAIHAINPGALSDFIDTHRVRLLSNIRAKCDEGKTVQSDIRRNVRLSRHQLQIFRTAHKNSVYRYLEFADFIESVVDLAEGKASIIDFDEVFYLSTYPDVNESVRNGGFPCGYIHYCVAGKNEGRFWRAREPAGAPGILAEIATYTPTGRA